MKNELQSQNLFKVDPRNVFFNPQPMFLLRDKLITRGEKRETPTKIATKQIMRNKFLYPIIRRLNNNIV